VGRLGQPPGTATDRWVTIAVATEQQWQALCRAIGKPELASDPRFSMLARRYEHQDELDAIITAWTSQRSDDEAMALLQAAGVPAFAVRTPLTIAADPHLTARGFYRTVEHPVAGSHRLAGPLWNFSTPRVEMRSAAPSFGQHNREVLSDLLGLSDRAVERLAAEGVISDAPVVRVRAAAPSR
jgi:benzylsuccinate CoA-transferase BbsF subunit